MELVQPHRSTQLMSVFNQGTLVGRIVTDITTRYPKDGVAITEFRVIPMGSRESESAQPVIAFNGDGKKISERFNKGDNIALTTRNSYNTWNDKNTGEPRGRYQVVVTSSRSVDNGLGKISKELREVAEAKAEAERTVKASGATLVTEPVA